ncbi:MAG: CDP-alcohol phosphatidyltransferase family protein [Planctomycetota bacterium]|jgi:phosphatidylglycerophosphate synthase
MAARNTALARTAAGWLARRGCRPNMVSGMSVVGSAIAGAAMLLGSGEVGAGRVMLFVVAISGIALRGACNLLDGLIAVECGRGTPAGEIFNDLPDRLSDAIVLVCAGYAAGGPAGPTLGWLAALASAVTAYVRVLGAASGAGHDFRGPMAKTGRMLALVAAIVVAAVEPRWGWDGQALAIGLVVITSGCVVTIVRRTAGIIRTLEAR